MDQTYPKVIVTPNVPVIVQLFNAVVRVVSVDCMIRDKVVVIFILIVLIIVVIGLSNSIGVLKYATKIKRLSKNNEKTYLVDIE